MWWAEAVARSFPSFKALASKLKESEDVIVKEMTDCQGKAVDIGGYWLPDVEKCTLAMQPSATFNALIDEAVLMSALDPPGSKTVNEIYSSIEENLRIVRRKLGNKPLTLAEDCLRAPRRSRGCPRARARRVLPQAPPR